jgi:hypothetical protein
MSVKIGDYEYQISNKKNKKLMTIVDGKKVHFGDKNMQHYHDKTELLDKSLNHGDEKRKEKYLKRAKGIKNKNGDLVYNDPRSANFHSINILWD